MKVKINSSVVKFNLLALVLSVLGFIAAWVSGNMQVLNEVLTVEQVAGIVAIVNIINLVLRTTNTLGLKPFEVVEKDTKDSPETKE